MIVKINGVPIAMAASSSVMEVQPVNFTYRPAVLQATDWMLSQLDKWTWKIVVTAVAFAMCPQPVFAAAAVGNGGWALISLLQQGAFWVGMAVSIWGVYEWQVGGPGWKERIAKGVLGYLLVLILPLIFTTLRAAVPH